MKINAKIKFTNLNDNECRIGFVVANSVEFQTVIFPASYIPQILYTLEVHSYEELKRKFCRIEVEKGYVISIGNIIEDRWFYLC